MQRREAVKHAALLAFGMVMGKFDSVKASQASQAQLLVNLDQWKEVVFTLNGKKVAISTSEIYDALQTRSTKGTT